MNKTLMQKQLLDIIIENIENFDKKKIQFTIISPLSRSGSVLLQSLFDNHYQVISPHLAFWFYFDWESKNYSYLKQYENDYEKLTNEFIFNSSFSSDWSCKLRGGLCKDYIDIKRSSIKDVLLEILPNLSTINRKNFLLAFFFAYATVFNIDIKHTKALILHHHYLPTGNILETILEDFPKVKLMCTVRDPIDAHNSMINYLKYPNELLNIKSLSALLKEQLRVHHKYLHIQEKLHEQTCLVKFESIHKDVQTTMQSLSDYIGIDYNNTLKESTLGGVEWQGNSKERIIKGVDPNTSFDKWKYQMDPTLKTLYLKFYNPLSEKMGYSKHPFDDTLNVYSFVNKELSGWLYSIKELKKDPKQFKNWVLYPYQRKKNIQSCFKQYDYEGRKY